MAEHHTEMSHGKYESLVKEARRFDTFYAFIEALYELGEFGAEPLDDHMAITGFMGAGASDYLRIGDFLRLRAALLEATSDH